MTRSRRRSRPYVLDLPLDRLDRETARSLHEKVTKRSGRLLRQRRHAGSEGHLSRPTASAAFTASTPIGKEPGHGTAHQGGAPRLDRIEAGLRAPPKEYFDTEGAAEFTSISTVQLAEWRSRGGGPRYIKMGRKVLYR